MSVLAFERKQSTAVWSEAELGVLLAALDAALAPESGREWETGATETGDAQFCLLGPFPDQACELCVSRVGGRYLLEDGRGRLLFEHRSLPLIAMHAKAAVRSRRWPLVARVFLLWCAVRHLAHDEVEPMFAESGEMPVHLVPQLAAFARLPSRI